MSIKRFAGLSSAEVRGTGEDRSALTLAGSDESSKCH